MKKNLVLTVTGLMTMVLGVLFGQVLLTPSTSVPQPDNSDPNLISPPMLLPQFQLVDHHNQPFTHQQLKQKWHLLFFGYTHCPDICPTTLLTMRSLYQQLEQANLAGKLNMVFVSVDPKRDTVEQLSQYVPFYHPKFIGVTGDLEQIYQLSRPLGVVVHYRNHKQSQSDDDSDDYLVDHSANLFLIDPQARLYARFAPPFDVPLLQSKISHFIQTSSPLTQ